MMIRKCHLIMVVEMLLLVRGQTPDKTKAIRNYTLEYFKNGKTLSNAIATCISRNAWLVEIKDEEIGKAIEPWISHEVFIGGKYADNVWKWNDGSLMRYANWKNGAPNTDRAKNCLLKDFRNNYKWINTACEGTGMRYICQSDSSYPGSFQITVVKQSATFFEAETFCSNNGSRLVEIKTPALNAFINRILGDDSASYWTSGKYSGGSWKWGDGNSISTSDSLWADSEPSGANQNCLMKGGSKEWKAVECTNKAGYICQRNLTSGSCENKVCLNRGSCSIVDQRYKCSCYAGYFGTKCEKNIITISTAKISHNIKRGQSITKTFQIVSYDGNVDVKDINKDRVIKSTSGITSSSLTDSFDFTLGPFNITTSSIDYVFEVTSENSESTRLTLIINVKDQCDSNPCKNDASCNYLTSTPYFTCTCLPAYEGNTCDERVFVEIDDCKYHVNNEQRVKFEEANSICHDLGGSLTMMKTNILQDFVEVQIVKQYGLINTPPISFWIGGVKRSNSWYWLDDTEIPLTGEHAQWRWNSQYKANITYMVLSSYSGTRLSMIWFSKKKDEKHGFLCEVAKTDLCASLACNHNGKCIAVGCQTNCICSLEYYGTHCERESIQMISREENVTSVIGQSIDVTLDVESHHGLVKVDLSKDNKSFAIATQNHINELVTFTIGPFLQITPGTQYYFRASPQLYPDVFFTYASISVIVRESIQIIPRIRNFTSVIGQTINVTLDIEDYDDMIKIEVLKNSNNSIPIATKNYVNDSATLTIGPFMQESFGTKYYFRASPYKYPDAYYSYTFITVIVKDYCSSEKCKNEGKCKNLSRVPYFKCICTPAYSGQMCEDMIFVENENCQYHINHDHQLIFEEANSTCSNLNGSLAMVKSAVVENLIELQSVKQYGRPSSGVEFWIGGHNIHNVWNWMDGTEISLNQHWHVLDANNAAMNFLVVTLDENRHNSTRWKLKTMNQSAGYICEISKVKLCISLSCRNRGICKAVGCQENCLCLPGYFGTLCENDYLTITPESTKYTAVVGKYLTIMLDIQNYDGLVKVDVFANSIDSPSIITVNYINKSTAIAIGPFTKNNATAKYYFRASPQMHSESYNRWTSITVVVQETATTTVGFTQQTQSSTLAIIFVSIYGLLITIIVGVLFVRNRKKIDGKTKTELSPSGVMSSSREEKIESPYSYDNDNIYQTSSFESSTNENYQYENHPTNTKDPNSLYETVKPSTVKNNEFRAYEDIN